MEFKSTSISAAHLSLSSVFLSRSVDSSLTKSIKHSVHEVNTGCEMEILEGKEGK